MADPKVLAGRATVRVNGQRLALEPGAKLTLGGIESEAVTTDDPNDVYFGEKVVPGMIEGKMMVPTGTKVDDIGSVQNASILFETNAGVNFVMNGARQANVLVLENGRVDVKFIGAKARQI